MRHPSRFRSKLFVPGSRPELLPKALAGPADAVSLDLEDSVLEARKAEARAAVVAFLDSPAATGHGKCLLVRVNAAGSAHHADDLDAVARAATDVVNLPKVESPDEVRDAAQRLARLERERGIAEPIGLLANVESPRGLRLAHAIAAADPRVVGLQAGFGDLFSPLGIDRADAAALHAVLLALRLAAGEAGVALYDGAFPDLQDAAGLEAEAVRARRLGCTGKSCIHPSQVAVVHAVFAPSAEALAAARRVVAAWEHAEREGRGAIAVDGQMVDRPYLERARAVLAQGGST